MSPSPGAPLRRAFSAPSVPWLGNRPVRGGRRAGRPSAVSQICREAVAAAAALDGTGNRVSIVPKGVIPQSRNARKERIKSDANRVAQARRNPDRCLDERLGLSVSGTSVPLENRILPQRDHHSVMNGLSKAVDSLALARIRDAARKRPASAGARCQRVSSPVPQDCFITNTGVVPTANAYGSLLRNDRSRRPASAGNLRRTYSCASDACPDQQQPETTAAAAPYSSDVESWPPVLEWKAGPFIPRLPVDESMDTNAMLHRALTTDAMSEQGERDMLTSQRSPAIPGKLRPKSAPALRHGWKRPEPVSQENPVAARIRKGEMRLKCVPDNASFIYNNSEYRREYPRREDKLPGVKIDAQKYAPTAPC